MIRAVIIEDDPMVCEINKRYIKKDGRIKDIQIFSNGLRALEYLEHNTTELILLDIYMPKIYGFELLQKIRLHGIPTDVIVVTAANDFLSMEKALRLGTLDYLVKPFEYERFQHALDKFFCKRRMNERISIPLSQKDADELFALQEPFTSKTKNIKGIQSQTLDIIQEYLTKHSGKKYASNDLAQKIGFSRVTVHKYLNYLEAQKIVESQIDYDTDGRPRLLYYIVKDTD